MEFDCTLLILLLLQVYFSTGFFLSTLRWSLDCETDYVFTSFHEESLVSCTKKCIRREQCLGINYYRMGHYCQLIGNESTLTLLDHQDMSGVPCVNWTKPAGPHTYIPSYNSSGIGDCDPNPCLYGEVCSSVGNVQCKIEECVNPTHVAQAYIVTNINRVGSKAFYNCDSGYNQTDSTSNVRKCRPDGTWSTFNFTCMQPCNGVPLVPNALPDVTPVESPLYTSIIYTCVNNTLSPSNVTVTCLPNTTTSLGYWSPPSSTCLEQCGTPSVGGPATITSHVNLTQYPAGSVLHYNCNPGFTPTDVQNLTCNVDGLWIKSAVCLSTVDCSSSLYEFDTTYGLCYKHYDSILTAAYDIAEIFEGYILNVTSDFERDFVEYIMPVKSTTRLFVGPPLLYDSSPYPNWADNHPDPAYNCTEIKDEAGNFVWRTMSCTDTIAYIIIKF